MYKAHGRLWEGREGGDKNMDLKHIGKKGVVVGMIAVSMLAGAVGATALKTNQASAQTAAPVQTTTTTPAVTTPNSGTSVNDGTAPSGTFHSNENPTHEATESPQREAQESAGQRPTVK